LIFPPTGSGWIIKHISINSKTLSVASNFMTLFSITAMIGLFTRTSSLMFQTI